MIRIEDPSIGIMRNRYLSSVEAQGREKRFTTWHFCDNQRDADELAQLVKSGIKTATASLCEMYDIDEEDTLPKVGEYSIITDWEGRAQCIIETIEVNLVPFKEVEEDFAYLEGEGDRTLEHWRKAHMEFFQRELKDHPIDFSEDMLVVCEKFKVVYK